MCFILSDLKCYGSITSSLEINFEVQRKRSFEKIIRKNKFPTYKTFFFSLFGPFLNLIIFLFLIHFKGFKVL